WVGGGGGGDVRLARAGVGGGGREAAALAERLLEGRLEARHRRSPFRFIPPLHTDFWPVAGAVAAGLAAVWLGRPGSRRRRKAAHVGTEPAHPPSPSPKRPTR